MNGPFRRMTSKEYATPPYSGGFMPFSMIKLLSAILLIALIGLPATAREIDSKKSSCGIS